MSPNYPALYPNNYDEVGIDIVLTVDTSTSKFNYCRHGYFNQQMDKPWIWHLTILNLNYRMNLPVGVGGKIMWRSQLHRIAMDRCTVAAFHASHQHALHLREPSLAQPSPSSSTQMGQTTCMDFSQWCAARWMLPQTWQVTLNDF